MAFSLSEKVLKVSEFNELFDKLVSYQNVIIEGEISQINVNQDKWLFLTIKDAASQIEVFAIAYSISTLPMLKEGMLVHVYGTPHIHQKSGRFRITAQQIIPAGVGELRAAFDLLKLKMEKEGFFAPERKRKLPEFPTKIALLTAENSQAYSDFIKIISQRTAGIKIYYFPISVQGSDSINSIVNAFRLINAKYDHLDFAVLTRGGGSLEDLQSFNSEDVVKTVFSSKIPVVSAIGHEKDITLCDLAADLRASTPSNAAELVTRDKKEIFSNLNLHKRHLIDIIDSKLNMIDKESKDTLSIIDLSSNKNLSLCENSLQNYIRILNSLNIDNILKRGFSITLKNDKILRDVKTLVKGDIIKSKLFNGTVWSKISQ